MDEFSAVESIFFVALGKGSPEERDGYLDDACGQDRELRGRVVRLLNAHRDAGAFLEASEPVGVATVDVPPVGERPGATIGPYKLVEQIGEGGMGLVYMAEQQRPLRRMVALKIIKPGMDSRQVLARFEAEKQALAMMDHENIAKVFDAGTTEAGHPFFVMELVRGIPIHEFCNQKHLTVRERLELFIPVCQAVQHAHQKGIIHRDLKPSNVLVTMHDVRPVPKVIDFGIAKALGASLTEQTLHTGFAQLVGTPLYMSPEQAEMNQLGVDTRSDVYSLGVLLYELLTGTTPFDKEALGGSGLEEMRRMIREDEPPRPSARVSTLQAQAASTSSLHRGDPRRVSAALRGELDWIVMKSLEKDRGRRYESASAFATDIQRYLCDEPVLACPPSTMYKFHKFARKHKAALATAVAIAASLILGTTASAWQAVRATTAEAQANANEVQAKEAAAAEAQQRQRAEANEQKASANAAQAQEKAQEANTQRDEAQKQRDEVKALADRLAAKEQQLQRTLYAAHMNLAWHAWEAGATDQVEELLQQHRPKPGEPDLRGFEWHYLHRLCHSELLTLQGHTDYIYCVAFSPGGKRLASASADKTVKVWDAQTGKELLTFKGHIGEVNSVAFSPDGKRLASATGSSRTRDKTPGRIGIKVWDAETGQELVSIPGGDSVVAFNPDGKRLASASSGNTVKVWDAQSGQELLACKGHTDYINQLAFSPDGKRVASASADRTVKVWDTQTGQELLSLKEGGYGLDFSRDGKRLVSAGEDGASKVWEVKVWDAQTGQELLSLNDVAGSMAFRPDGKEMATSSTGRTLRIWDLQTGQEVRTLKGAGRMVVYSPDGRRLASSSAEGSADNTVKIWNAQKDQESLSLQGIAGKSVAFSPDGKRVASHSGDRTVKLWDAQTLEPTLILKGHTAPVHGVAFSPDGKRLVSAGGGHSLPNGGTGYSPEDPTELKVWDVQTGQELLALEGITDAVFSVAFSPDGKRLASPHHVWDAQTGQELLSLKGRRGWASSVAFSPDGKRLATGGGEGVPGEVKVWDAQTGQELLTLQGAGLGVVFSPDGQRLASAAVRPEIKVWVWDVQTGQEVLALKGGGRGVAFSPDGKRLASGGKIWDAESGQQLLSLKGGRGGVAFSGDGHRLASTIGGKLTIWDATPLPEKP